MYGGKLDQEYGAALYILTADTGTWERVRQCVSRGGIRFDAILKHFHWSSGYSVLLQLAGNLFGQDQHVDPVELMCLDPCNFQVALSALRRRSKAFQLTDFGEYLIHERKSSHQ